MTQTSALQLRHCHSWVTYVCVDPDHITDTNTNRLISGTLADVRIARSKVAIAKRQIRRLIEKPRIIAVKGTWHNAIDRLRYCDVIVGAVDSFIEREQLERFARRHLIPYIDIGMDVHEIPNGQFLISGQVLLSMANKPCLRCCGVVTDDRLKQEAGKYGAAGSKPQVVWSNGVLASTAVGLITQLLTPWHRAAPEFVYLDYDGNLGTLTPNERMRFYEGKTCPHHPNVEVGDSLFDVRTLRRGMPQLSSAEKLWECVRPKNINIFGLNGRRRGK